MTGLCRTPNFRAGGNISPMHVVRLTSAADDTVVETTTAHASTFGIAQRATRNPPGTASDDGYAAISGENVQVHGAGEIAWAVAGGSISAGDHVKSDGSGLVVTASSTNYCVGYALQASTGSGQLIRVFVLPHTM